MEVLLGIHGVWDVVDPAQTMPRKAIQLKRMKKESKNKIKQMILKRICFMLGLNIPTGIMTQVEEEGVAHTLEVVDVVDVKDVVGTTRKTKYGHFVSKCPERNRNHEVNLNEAQEKGVYHEEGTFFMMNHIQETIFMNEEKCTPQKSESNTDEDDACWGSLLIKAPRNEIRLYKAQLKVGKENINEVGRESCTFIVLCNDIQENGTNQVIDEEANPHSSLVTDHETSPESKECHSRSDDTPIPITRLETIRLLIALATGKGCKIHHLDVKMDFLNGDRKKLDITLKEMGFQQCMQEKPVYKAITNGDFIIVAVYRDDLFVTGASLDLINEFKRRMASQFKMSNLGELTYYLGIEVSQGKDCVEIKQERYARKILKEGGMED
nr:zinc finger, CCHC-type [Tanacetum cinerariifolium]